MIERFLFNGIDAIAAGTAIGGEYDLVLLPRPHETQALLTFVQFAETGTDVALNAPILQAMPILSRNYRHARFTRHHLPLSLSICERSF